MDFVRLDKTEIICLTANTYHSFPVLRWNLRDFCWMSRNTPHAKQFESHAYLIFLLLTLECGLWIQLFWNPSCASKKFCLYHFFIPWYDSIWLSKETQIAAIPKNSFNNQRCNNWKTYSNSEEKEKNPVSGAMPSLLV